MKLEGEAPEVAPPHPAVEVMEVDQDQGLDDDAGDWHFPLLKWIIQRKLPADKTEARWIARQAKSYKLIEGDLYR